MIVRMLSLAAIVVAISLASSATADAAQPDLFANYYVGPAPYAGGIPAQMYISPRPTPPLVGHTYITYQPLMPHEMLYRHKRNYYTYHPYGGHTVTKVCWW
jgi:hypothetical protein